MVLILRIYILRVSECMYDKSLNHCTMLHQKIEDEVHPISLQVDTVPKVSNSVVNGHFYVCGIREGQIIS